MSNKDTPTPLRRLFKLLSTQKQEVYNIYLYALFNGLLNLSIPLGISAIINLIQAGTTSTSWVILVTLVLVGLTLAGIFQIYQLAASETIQQRIFANASIEFAFRLPRLKLSELKASYPPELVNRFFDIMTVQKGLSKILFDFSIASLQIFFGLLLLAFYHPFFIAFGILALLLLVGYLGFTAKNGLTTSLEESKKKYAMVGWLEEVGRNLKTFKLSGNNKFAIDRTDEHSYGYLKSRKSHFSILMRQYIFLVGFKVVIAGSLLIIGGVLVFRQQMNIGQFVAAEIIILMVTNSVEKLILSMETIYDVLTGLEKIGAITDLGIEGQKGASTKLDNNLNLRAKNLGLNSALSEKRVLCDLNFEIKQGCKIGITGEAGSGKSTLLHTLAGLHDHFDGQFTVNNIPLRELNLDVYRDKIAENITENEIFEGTLLENVTLNDPEISIDRVMEVLTISGLEEFVENLPRGVYTLLPSSGLGLSRSVRNRIGLARCLATTAPVILIDDNHYQQYDHIRKRWLNHILSLKDQTVIIASTDESLLSEIDEVWVLKNGSIKAKGKYNEIKNQL